MPFFATAIPAVLGALGIGAGAGAGAGTAASSAIPALGAAAPTFGAAAPSLEAVAPAWGAGAAPMAASAAAPAAGGGVMGAAQGMLKDAGKQALTNTMQQAMMPPQKQQGQVSMPPAQPGSAAPAPSFGSGNADQDAMIRQLLSGLR